jgi:aromatic-L-amino-acid decarboxylase
MAICRDADALAASMNSDAVYATSSSDSQKNLTLEFSRRARGVSVWAALRSLGRNGIEQLVERHCAQAQRIADGLKAAGFNVLNRVVLNQVVARADTEQSTTAIREAAQRSGEIWFGPTVWRGQSAFRFSVSSWRTTDAHIDRAIALMTRLWPELTPQNAASPEVAPS